MQHSEILGVVRMLAQRARSTEFLPLLSRGKHRRPRDGACMMEYASYLAGQRWSDHPACTHPLVGELARQVNDFTSDQSRQALVEFVPDMIDLTGDDLRIDLCVALRAARTAFPVVAEQRLRIMAVAILACERLRADLAGCPGAPLTEESRDVLALAPATAAWASGFTRDLSVSQRAFRRQTAPTVVRCAVQGIAHACLPDPDALLRALLAGVIEDCKALRTAVRRRRPTRDDRVAATGTRCVAAATTAPSSAKITA
jgi:hypothetical protein